MRKLLFTTFLIFISCLYLFAHELVQDSLRTHLLEETSELNAMDIIILAGQNLTKNLNKAFLYADLAEIKALKNKEFIPLFHARRAKGIIWEDKGQLKSALSEYQKALEAGNLSDDVGLLLTIYNDLAILYRKLGQYKTAKEYHYITLELAQKHEDLFNIENSYHGLGFLYETLGDFTTAIDFYFQSLAIAEQRQDKGGQVITLQNIASVYQKSKNPDLAEKTIAQSLSMGLEMNDSMRLASIHVDYGRILVQNQKFEEGLSYLATALTQYQQLKNEYHEGRTLILIADAYLQQNQFEIAKGNLLRSIELKAALPPLHLTQLYNKLGLLYEKIGDQEEAIKAYRESGRLAKEYQYTDWNLKNQLGMYRVLEQQNNFQQALEHHKRAVALQDSLFNKEKSNSIAELQFKYDLAQSQITIQDLELEKSQLRYWSGFAISGVLLLSLAIFLFIKMKNNRVLQVKNQAIQRKNQQLQSAVELQKEVAFIAAHDLKEPLRNIGSFVGLLKRRLEREMREEVKDYMGFILNNTNRMNELLTALLQYSTLSYQAADVEWVEPTTVLEEVETHFKSVILDKEAKLVYAPELPAIQINRLHLFLLFKNLISNALKFNNKAPIIQIDIAPNEKVMLIKVKDNGIGIDAAYSAKVFQLFQQLDKNTLVANNGVGLGLSMCKNIVEKYGGSIWFESELGKGTSFYVELPKFV